MADAIAYVIGLLYDNVYHRGNVQTVVLDFLFLASELS